MVRRGEGERVDASGVTGGIRFFSLRLKKDMVSMDGSEGKGSDDLGMRLT